MLLVVAQISEFNEEVDKNMSNTVSATTRKRGRGTNAEERKRSRAAFKAWDTRRAMAAAARKRSKKAWSTRRKNK